MRFAYFLSRNIYRYLLPSIMSLLDHNKNVKAIYVFCEDDMFPYELPDVCKVINITDQPWIRHDSPNWSNMFTWVGLVRPCLPKLLPRVNKVIQLDVDTIICDDLSPLWNTDMGDSLMMAADEKIGHYRIPGHDKYFNVGVAVLNLKQIREEHFDDRLIDALNSWHFTYIGQDAWNWLAYDRIMEMPTRYNECFATGASDDPAIVHYASVGQWWLQGVPRQEYYDKYRVYENK